MARVDTLLALALKHKASDLHLRVGFPPLIRVHGRLQPLPGGASNDGDAEILLELLSEDQLHVFEKRHDLDFAYELSGVGRFRANFLRQRQGIGAVFRVIPSQIPTLGDLGLPPVVFDLARLEQGLVLVTGPTGSGKSTTLAAIIDHINQESDKHM
jgi:twitching motility protein PilT